MAETVISITELVYNGRTIGSALCKIRRVGQEDPATSDSMDVEAEIELPPDDETRAPQTLHRELRFGTRCNLMGNQMIASWSGVPGKVARRQSFSGADYATLVAQATAYLNTELAKLTSALSDREAAREAAG